MDRFRAGGSDLLDLDDRDRGRRRRPERDRDARRERGAVRARAAAPAPRPDRPRRHDAFCVLFDESDPDNLEARARLDAMVGDHRRLRARRRGPAAARRGHALRRAAVGDARPAPGAARRGRRAGRAGQDPGLRAARGRPGLAAPSRAARRAPRAGSRARSTGCSAPEPASAPPATLPRMRIIAGSAKGTRLGPVPAGDASRVRSRPRGRVREPRGAGRGRAASWTCSPGPARWGSRRSRAARPQRGSSTGRRRRWRRPGQPGARAAGGPGPASDVLRAVRSGRGTRGTRTTSSSSIRRTTSARPSSTPCLAAPGARLAPRRRLDGDRDPRSEGFAACGSATLGRREAAPVRGQPPDPLPGGWMGLTALCPGTFDPVTYGHLDIIGRAPRRCSTPSRSPWWRTRRRRRCSRWRNASPSWRRPSATCPT